MALQQIKASPHPDGNRIDLSWVLPADAGYVGVRVVRRAGTYPSGPDDGVNVAQAAGLLSATDTELQAQQTYYYMLFPYQGDPPVFQVDTVNRTAAMATSAENFADYMYELLPAIYRRYDRQSQTLKRFLQLPGGQLDQLHSFARAAGELQDYNRVSGDLLPLLAEWIGWKTDYKRELDAQRNEIRHAPALYKSVGLMPTVGATVKRNSGWESRSKEFVHNIFATNRPARLNLWSMQRDNAGVWSASAERLSMDYVFEGRPSSTLDNNGIRWLFYHTERKGRWEIWFKSSPTIELDPQLANRFVDGVLSAELLQALGDAGLLLTPAAVLSTLSADSQWQIVDAGEVYVIEQQQAGLLAYHSSAELDALAPSQPIVVGKRFTYKYPSAAQQLTELWLFWSAFDAQQQHWQIQYRRRSDTQWSSIAPDDINPALDNPFAQGGVYDPLPQRRSPCALVDGDDRLWLFWLEDDGSGWRLRYNRRDGPAWGTPVDFPATPDLGMSLDFSLLIQPALPNQRLYVFWSRATQTSTPGQVRWEVAYREKQDLNLDDLNWGAIHSMPRDAVDDNHHDRDAVAVLVNNDIEVFWSSNRQDAGWSVWRSLLTDPATNTWDAVSTERITDGIYWQRHPLPVVVADRLWLLFRSSQGIAYNSQVYGATETFDQRYVGSTTVDQRHLQKFALWKSFEDIQSYTYDAGVDGEPGDDDWIARNTIGIYLDNDTLDAQQLAAGIARLKPVLKEFMPITDRAVFIPATELHTDNVYNYGQPVNSASRYLSSTYQDELNGVLITSAFGVGEDFFDGLED